MVRALKGSLGLTAWLLAGPTPLFAQSAAGTIAGTARDTTGAVLPGVTVEAASPALIEKVRTAIGAQAIGETGRELFVNYCATCHGVDAKGQGPTASALKIRPPDLTMIAKKNGGIFPAGRIQSLVFGPDTFPSAHGSVHMPIWGPTFRRLDPSGDGQARFAKLIAYLESIQMK